MVPKSGVVSDSILAQILGDAMQAGGFGGNEFLTPLGVLLASVMKGGARSDFLKEMHSLLGPQIAVKDRDQAAIKAFMNKVVEYVIKIGKSQSGTELHEAQKIIAKVRY